MKQKALVITFNELLMVRNCFRPESWPLNKEKDKSRRHEDDTPSRDQQRCDGERGFQNILRVFSLVMKGLTHLFPEKSQKTLEV